MGPSRRRRRVRSPMGVGVGVSVGAGAGAGAVDENSGSGRGSGSGSGTRRPRSVGSGSGDRSGGVPSPRGSNGGLARPLVSLGRWANQPLGRAWGCRDPGVFFLFSARGGRARVPGPGLSSGLPMAARECAIGRAQKVRGDAMQSQRGCGRAGGFFAGRRRKNETHPHHKRNEKSVRRAQGQVAVGKERMRRAGGDRHRESERVREGKSEREKEDSQRSQPKPSQVEGRGGAKRGLQNGQMGSHGHGK